MPLAEIVDLGIVQEWAEAGDEGSARFLKAASRCPNPLFGVAEDEVAAWFDSEAAADAWLLEALVDSEVESLETGETGVVLDPFKGEGARPGPGMVWVAWDDGTSGWTAVSTLIEPEE